LWERILVRLFHYLKRAAQLITCDRSINCSGIQSPRTHSRPRHARL
jgi:hypothetical protein